LVSISYFVAGAFTGYSKAAFPYLLASREGQTIYSPECAPEGFSLMDPEHITSFKTNDLYNHWLQRQRKKLTPFIILNSGPLHQGLVGKSEKGKGKRKIDYVQVTTDEEDAELGGEDSEKDESESENEDGGHPPPKFGPPDRKQQKLAPKTPPLAAGSSKLTQPDIRGVKNPPKIRKAKNDKLESTVGPVDEQVRVWFEFFLN
jgi:hypothetical protein